jgi:hypothetical protein
VRELVACEHCELVRFVIVAAASKRSRQYAAGESLPFGGPDVGVERETTGANACARAVDVSSSSGERRERARGRELELELAALSILGDPVCATRAQASQGVSSYREGRESSTLYIGHLALLPRFRCNHALFKAANALQS